MHRSDKIGSRLTVLDRFISRSSILDESLKLRIVQVEAWLYTNAQELRSVRGANAVERPVRIVLERRYIGGINNFTA